MKEQAAEPTAGARWTRGLRADSLAWARSDALRKAAVPALFVLLALLVTTGYGTGVQLNDGQASLHIDPLKFLTTLFHAWNPSLYLGAHTGFWFPYETPYAWAYGIAQLLGIPQELAQRIAVFLVYLGCLFSMHYCLRSVTPWLNEAARVAGSCAYLFNMYVALNSQAQIVWLLTYATLPALIGVTARTMRGEMNLWRGTLAVALLVVIGGGINPPLLAINVIVMAIFVVVTILFDPQPLAAAKRAAPFLAAAAIASVAINLYWLVPIVDYFRGVWLNGVLSEAPSMHNAATSFDNVLRGLGHWATFVSFNGKAYFPWAAPYAQGFFGALLWFVPIVALGGIAFRINQRPATLFFLIVTIVSVPLVVGYYHDALGDAVTTPIYDTFYRNFPGFQMFRFSYKWVAGVEFGISALYALAAFALVAWVGDQVENLEPKEREGRAWIAPALTALLVAVPVFAFVPVLINKMNYPGPVIPAWEYREKALVGDDQRHRVALFPTQFLEQFDWGSPEFYIEDSLVDRPMIYGLLGSEPSEGTDRWVRRGYRATREGLPFAGDMYRVLGVDTILQRDDFISTIDFSSPGESRFNTTTLTHDLLHRVLGATPVRADGPLHVYHISGALPLVYGVTHPVVNTLPTFTDAYLGDVKAMAHGVAEFDPPSRSADDFTNSLAPLSPILPDSPDQVRDLAVNQALQHGGIRIHPPSADVGWTTPFTVTSGGEYAVFAMEQSLLFDRDAPQNLQVDGHYFSPQTTGGAWTQYGTLQLAPGAHVISDGYPDPDLIVALVSVDDLDAWQARIGALARSLPHNLSSSTLVYAPKASIKLDRAGEYVVRAGAVGSSGPDGLEKAAALRHASFAGAFPTDLSSTLPYVFGDGVLGTQAVMMPDTWYGGDASTYRWQRGDSMPWFLFARNAHVRVFVPGRDDVVARADLHVSRLQVSRYVDVSVDGANQRTVALDGPPADSTAYDTIYQLSGPSPVPAGFTVSLHPGWNDVVFTFHPVSGERGDLGTEVISAAVAPDLTFTRTAGLGLAAREPQADGAFNGLSIAPPPNDLAGDPDIVGTVAGSGGVRWIAAAIQREGKIDYRLFPVATDGSFDINFLHAFPNDWVDQSRRVVGIWFLARDGRATLSSVFYNLHAMPAREMRRPQSLDAPPITIDKRPVLSEPVYLTAGRHLVASADRQVKLGLLTVTPVTLPKTTHYPLQWDRRSPTSVDVTVRGSPDPFLLVFGEAYHPKWEAMLDGTPLKHVVVDGLVNGWIVPPVSDATATIELRFADQLSYVVSGLISLVSLILLVVLAWMPGLWPTRKHSP